MFLEEELLLGLGEEGYGDWCWCHEVGFLGIHISISFVSMRFMCVPILASSLVGCMGCCIKLCRAF